MRKLLALLLALMLGAAACAEAPDTSRVADAAEMTDVEDVVPEGLTPVTADTLNDGVYGVAVDCSSSMFKILACELTASGGALTAKLVMKSDSYLYLYPGTAPQAAEAPFDALIPLETDGSAFAFTFPVSALNADVDCAAFSARKQAWYPRTLLFRADSLPPEAWRERVTAGTLGLADGAYTCQATLTGGKTSLLNPATLTVSGGECTAQIAFDTKKIDYVIVEGQKYEPVSFGDGAVFSVPVEAFDVGLAIIVDSTAIKPAAEVPYTVTFDSESISKK